MDRDPFKSGPVVSLSDVRRWRMPAAITQIEGYWQALRSGRLVPLRSDVDPRGLSGALEHAFVIERIAPGLARFRVAGMHLTDIMGLEVRGMPISAIFLTDARMALSEALEAVFGEPATVRLGLRGEGGIGRPELVGTMTILPLRSDAGQITRALGGVVMEGGIGRQPRRLTITSVSHKTLVGYGEADADPAPAPALAEMRTPFTPAPGQAEHDATCPHLRLVHSSD